MLNFDTEYSVSIPVDGHELIAYDGGEEGVEFWLNGTWLLTCRNVGVMEVLVPALVRELVDRLTKEIE